MKYIFVVSRGIPSIFTTHQKYFTYQRKGVVLNNIVKVKLDTITADGRKNTLEKHTFKIYKLKLYYLNNIWHFELFFLTFHFKAAKSEVIYFSH